jgi:hypothetical protein
MHIRALVFSFFLGWMGISAQDMRPTQPLACASASETAQLNDVERAALISAFANNDCTFEGINLWGKVQFVDHFPDIKIQFVDHFPDIKVKYVDHFPDRCGLWQVVDHFPDIKIQVVDHFPDLKVKLVDHFPGVD